MAAMIAISESVPEEINNQIRNAFTHVARAAHAETLTDVNAEVEKAIGHIERACRDCLKVSIIYARENLDQLVADVVFFYGFMPPDTKAKLATLKSLRREANVAETRGDKGQVEKLEEILRIILDASDDITARYDRAGKTHQRFFRKVKLYFRPLWFIVAGLVGAALSAILRPYLGPFVSDAFGYLRSLIGI